MVSTEGHGGQQIWKSAEQAAAGLEKLADGTYARTLQRFFKTGPGEYGEKDRFLGVRVPVLRRHMGAGASMDHEEVGKLLASPWHEVRMFALLLWVDRYKKGDESRKEMIFKDYLSRTACVNNWDLVDVSAPGIVGTHLLTRERHLLYELAASVLLWDRRIAMVSTLTLIRHGLYDDALRLADILSHDTEPLIHKAVGWMLREVGKGDRNLLENFLAPRCRQLPRILLRYSIEHFSADSRKVWLSGNLPTGLS
ncbi:DNA alkylation repair protein [Desulfobotulus sp. H1]|uniref:DNA alkylation repair protein n=1 Tax=Desulfobotulus pelophilus TaxID=2823377 RepID=A0ABT3N560_9BACT|nr:DNA alkylation repair protein [Desulfobotulus pelophilus]MCW7752601.1 DNA alkylation repair protein [Desulfobotulus pelophilus]